MIQRLFPKKQGNFTPLKLAALAASVFLASCGQSPEVAKEEPKLGKPVVYQMMTRLFGNKNQTNKPWGTLEENGVGKFDDINDAALEGIKELGVTHVWYTGVPHHGVIRDYTEYGISLDDPDVIKGRAGSPYAVRDYYSVNPDLAVDPSKRMEEFEALIERTHKQNLKVIIDIVPNHVARNYNSLGKPEGVVDFGVNDDTSVEYKRDNNFYYVVGEAFKVPEPLNGYQPLGGESHPLADGKFEEVPAKWTGNGARKAQPHFNDWYETVKINYGVKPDGSYDFERLPEAFREKDYTAHAAFWQGKSLPGSWKKFEEITHFWLDKGVDGFRYDMAEMVPVEFWSYLNSSIKMKNPDAFLIAEVYQPKLYRDYIQLGLMDTLYDKVGFYDSLKLVMQGKESTDVLIQRQDEVQDIEQFMLHFLENHDEQRIASPDFAGSAQMGMPAMVVSSLIGSSPNLLFYGQEVGEDGSEEPGFGDPTRTSIFDYMGVPAHQRWMNDGKFDGGQLTDKEQALRSFYAKLMDFSSKASALNGDYKELHTANKPKNGYGEKQFSFARWDNKQKIVVVSNFDRDQTAKFNFEVPADLIEKWELKEGYHNLNDVLSGEQNALKVASGKGKVEVTLAPLESVVLTL